MYQIRIFGYRAGQMDSPFEKVSRSFDSYETAIKFGPIIMKRENGYDWIIERCDGAPLE